MMRRGCARRVVWMWGLNIVMARLSIVANAIVMRVRAMFTVGPFGAFAAGLRRSGRITGTKQDALVKRAPRLVALIMAGVVVGCGPRAVEIDGDRIRDQLRAMALGVNGADALLKLASDSTEARAFIQEEAMRMRWGALQRRQEALQEERQQITEDRPLDGAAQERLTAIVLRRVTAEREGARLEAFLASLP